VATIPISENRYHLLVPSYETSWSERALAELQAAGYRRGVARTRVIDFLERQRCCVAAQEIHRRLRSGGKAIGLASVYRVLEVLAEKRLVQRLDLGDGVMRFEPVRSAAEHHHHIVCDDCGKIEPFADERLENAIRSVEQSSGYEVAAHDIVLRGACSSCR
jgi:Fur family transcriptional regulator, ferric uptake regulator